MEFQEVAKNRRSIRKYQDKPVSNEVVQELLDIACTAPSGVNTQPWYFAAITSPQARETYMGLMRNTVEKFHPVLAKRFIRNPQVITETESFLSTLGGAPVIILVFLLKPEFNEGTQARSHIISVAAAMENLMLAAYDKGLGTCCMTAPVEAGLSSVIEQTFASGKGEFLAAITLGYPEITPKMPPRRSGRTTIL